MCLQLYYIHCTIAYMLYHICLYFVIRPAEAPAPAALLPPGVDLAERLPEITSVLHRIVIVIGMFGYY